MPHALGIIGGGNMGTAIARGCASLEMFPPGQMIIAEVDQKKREALSQLGFATTSDPLLAAEAMQVILAVKPQVFAEVAKRVAPKKLSTIFISIMAGLNSKTIREALGGSARMIRVMPNVACQIGAGMSAIALGAGAKPGDENLAQSIFGALGKTLIVDESLMHAVTAVSGSGPAYVFLLAEAMQQAAIEMGLSKKDAQLLVMQTIVGAGRLLSESNQSATTLRQSVTSPGGTTAAALEVMFERELPETIVEALLAARNRGVELDQR